MNINRMNFLFWRAHGKVSNDARRRYQVWSLVAAADQSYYTRRWDWAMADDDYGVQLMALILEGQ